MSTVVFRLAERTDVETLVDLLADDPLGQTRESPGAPIDARYLEAFHAIEGDPNNEIIVAEMAGEVVGMLQLTLIPYLTHTGSWRGLIEGVRIASSCRGQGIGKALIIHTIERARSRRCKIIQLTSDKSRPEAIRFYEALGFVPSHEGMKLQL